MAKNECACEAKAGVTMMEKSKVWAQMAIASEETARVVYQWRSDPLSLQASLHISLPDFSTFYQDFRSEYFSCSGLSPFFLRYQDERLAFVRFRPYDHGDSRPFVRGAEISIIVDPEKRRQGFGLKALELATEVARQSQVHTLFAMIRPGNEASKLLFLKAGYTFTEHRTVNVESLNGREKVEVDVYS
jgi:RimJ/RimL family protein N-acetyltransferase